MRDYLMHPTQPRGAADYPVDGWDLVHFGDSPRRWVGAADRELADRVEFSLLVRAMHLTPALLAAHYVERPETYAALVNTCPGCGSVGTGRTCKKCGRARSMVAEPRPWTKSAKTCLGWELDVIQRGLTPIPFGDWQRASGAAAKLAADEKVQELQQQSEVQVAMTGVWHDEATGLDIPVRSIVSYVPREGGTLDNALGSLSLVGDASHNVWAARAYARGAHVSAALKHSLHAVASGHPRPYHVWALCEREAPFVVGRRRASADLLQAGYTALADLMGAYARAVQSQTWPGFDPVNTNPIDSWTEFTLEPWMTQGTGGSAAYFALEATRYLQAVA